MKKYNQYLLLVIAKSLKPQVTVRAVLLAIFLSLLNTHQVLASALSGTVKFYQKISDIAGGFEGNLRENDRFGWSVASIGDLDGDGVVDLAVGAIEDDSGGSDHGAVWILFLHQDSTVKSYQKISDVHGGFTGDLDKYDGFGASTAYLGDVDGDGVGDIIVGANSDDDGGKGRGALWMLFLRQDGTVKNHLKISDIAGGFTGVLDDIDQFGMSVASIGDIDKDGIRDLAVGAFHDDDGGTARGAVWILFLNNDGSVKSYQKISDTEGGFTGELSDYDYFGYSIAFLGDRDNDGVGDIAVGAYSDDDGGRDYGAIWLLSLNSDGTVKSHQKISATAGGFAGQLNIGDNFGRSITDIGDIDGDGIRDLAVGAYEDDDGGIGKGAVWILFLNGDGTVKSQQKLSDMAGGLEGELGNSDGDNFGTSITNMGDINGDGINDIIVGARNTNDGDRYQGAIYVLHLNGVSENGINDQLIASISFNDSNLEACIMAAASANNWTLVSEVKELNCNNQQIVSLDGLEHFTSLYFLSLSGNHINNITPLNCLIELKWLYLDDNQISDITGLEALQLLYTLHIRSNKISDIAPISQLVALKHLYLSNNQISNISPLSSLYNIQYLLIDNNEIVELSALAMLTSLKTLYAHSNNIVEITALNGLINLTRLNLSNNQIVELSPLLGLTKLEWLLLSDNYISDLTPLSSLNNLILLDLNLNNITEINSLGLLTKLQTLYLGYNSIIDISPLNSLTELQTLLLQNNQVSDVTSLAVLVSLKTLYLQYNQITEVTMLQTLTAANTINLSKNEGISCADLDLLDAVLGLEVVIKSDGCVSES